MPASYTSEPLLVRAGRACGLHGPHHGDHEHGQDSKGGQNPGQNQGPGQDEAGVGVPTPAGVRAAWLVPTVSVPGLVPGASAGPVWVAEVERVRAAARDERVPVEAVLVAERLTRTARQALARLDSLGAARRSGQDAVHAVLAAAATSLETFGRLPADCGDRPVAPADPGPDTPVWGVVRTVADELTGQLIVLDRYLAGVVEAINDADVAALTGHGQTVAARFGGEFVPVADPAPAPAVSSSTSTAPVDTAWLIGLFGVVATIVMAGAR